MQYGQRMLYQVVHIITYLRNTYCMYLCVTVWVCVWGIFILGPVCLYFRSKAVNKRAVLSRSKRRTHVDTWLSVGSLSSFTCRLHMIWNCVCIIVLNTKKQLSLSTNWPGQKQPKKSLIIVYIIPHIKVAVNASYQCQIKFTSIINYCSPLLISLAMSARWKLWNTMVAMVYYS